MPTRREVLKNLGAGAMATATLGAGKPALATHEATLRAFAQSAPSPWWLLAPLKNGQTIGLGWHVKGLGRIDRGAAVLELEHDSGRHERVHICTHEGVPKGLAHSALFDLILMDGGQGDKPTEETIGRVLLTLAEIIRENELGDDADIDRVTRMLSHHERVSIYGADTLT